MKRTVVCTIAVTGLLALTALVSPAQTTQTNKMQGNTSQTGSTWAGMNKYDIKFMKNAAIGGLFEVKSSNLALKKSKRSDVRQFAQMMIDQHTAANNELKQLAQSKGATLPTKLDKPNQQTYNQLVKLSGAAFDSAYLKAQHQAHIGA